MTSPNAELAMAYAAHAHRQGKDIETITEEYLQERYLQTSIEELANIMSGQGLDPREIREARRFQQEHTLHHWIEVQNVQKGLAPSSARILLEAERLEQRKHGDSRLPFAETSDVAKTKWMQRFKQRWNVKKGKFQAGECVPQIDAHAKVNIIQKDAHRWNFRSPAIRGRTKKGYHQTIPKLGPRSIISFTGGTGKRPLFLEPRQTDFHFFAKFLAGGRGPKPILNFEVCAVLQWFAWLRRECPHGKKILRLNLDESSVKLFMPYGRGHIVRLGARAKRRVKQPASRKEMRLCVTFVGIICDDPSIQPVLPQIILGSERALTQRLLKGLRPRLRSNVCLLRVKNGWMTAELMAKLMTLLGEKLEGLLAEYQPILLMDAYSAHLSPMVFRAAARAHIWLVVIPAKMTGLVQPLDTHVFYKFKMYLRQKFMESATQSATGRVPTESVIMATNDAVRYILQKYDWSRAFEENGFRLHGGEVRPRILETIGSADLTSCWNAQPLTLQQFQHIWPLGKSIPFTDLFAWNQLSPRRPSRHSSVRTDSIAEETQEPWLRRLRPRVASTSGAPSSSRNSLPSLCPRPEVRTEVESRRRGGRVAHPIAKSRPSRVASVMTAKPETSARR